MKVWVAVGGWNYEGYAEPMGIFSTEARARLAIAEGYKEYDVTSVFEYEIDQRRADGGTPAKSYKYTRS